MASRYGPSFWKLAALDLQLGIQQPSLSDAPCFAPLFLRPVQEGHAVTILSLAAYEASTLEYILHAQHAQHHKLSLDTCYCLSSQAAEEVAEALPGMVQCLQLRGGRQLSAASSQEDKLAFFTASTSERVCGTVQQVDVVIGARCSSSCMCSSCMW